MGCLAGCTSNDQTVENEKNTSETEQAESGEKTVITVARWGTDSEKEAFENIFAEFEKAHPSLQKIRNVLERCGNVRISLNWMGNTFF